MKKIALVLLLIAGFLALGVTPAYTWGRGHGHWHGGVFIGVGPFWGPYPYYWYPPPPPYYYAPPVVVEQPQVYVEQQPPPAPPPAPSAPPAYWYYCQSAKGYYPTVPSCPEEWVKVPGRPQ